MKHRYVESISLNPDSGVVASYAFSANGLYDPNVTGTGHQVMFFDQLAGVFYNHYTVTGAKIKCTFMSPNTTLYQGVSQVGVLVTSGTSAPTSWNDMLEQTKQKMVYKTLGNAGGGHDIAIVKKSVSLKRELGVRYLIDEDDNAGTSTSNPAEQVYFQVFAQGASDTSDSGNLEVLVEIEYNAIWHEPRRMTGS